MLFHTPTFLVFLLAFLACYGPAPKGRPRLYVVLVFSNIFYGWWDVRFLALLWVTIVVDFTLARRLGRAEGPRGRQALLALSVLTNLGLLGFFKYWNFVVDSASAVRPEAAGLRVEDIVLPVGISFYVFQSMSYTIDVYRRQIDPLDDLVEFAAYVCYFPQLVAGPIERASSLVPQLRDPAPVTAAAVLSGLTLFATGFLRKSLGDVLAALHDPVLDDVATSPPGAVVAAVLGFGLQIYFDFSGYSEMARGLSRGLGVELMANFASPYLATSFRDFWRRWHISLSQWLRDYLYIPLGGRRGGLGRTVRNLMITMALGGLWHGASWTFVVWGLLHGVFLVANLLWDRLVPPAEGRPARAARAVVGGMVTFAGVHYAWIFFRMPTLEQAWQAQAKVFEWLAQPSLVLPTWTLAAVLAGLLAVDIRRRRLEALDAAPVLPPPPRAALQGALAGTCLLLGLVFLAGRPTQQFIYFQF